MKNYGALIVAIVLSAAFFFVSFTFIRAAVLVLDDPHWLVAIPLGLVAIVAGYSGAIMLWCTYKAWGSK